MQNEVPPFVKSNNEIFLKQDEVYVCEDFLHHYLDTNENEPAVQHTTDPRVFK